MIPKIIHLCWLSGDKYPPLIKQCISSWKKIMPDYEIKLWSKENFDINSIQWTKEAFFEKNYAFVSDYIRFYALYNHGGIYLDSDVEIIKKFDDLLQSQCFFGYEYTGIPEAAVIGCVPHLDWIGKCKNWYENESFYDQDGNTRQVVVPFLIKKEFESFYHTKLIDDGKIRVINDNVIFPYQYFSPKNFYSGEVKIFLETYCIHHSVAAWVKETRNTSAKRVVHVIIIAVFGKKIHDFFIRIIHQIKSNIRKKKNKNAF